MNNSVSSLATALSSAQGVLGDNEDFVGYIQTRQLTDGTCQEDIAARHKVSGSNYDNRLSLLVDSNGVGTVSVTYPTAWCNALGLGDSGWQSLTNAAGFSGTIYYRKIGSIVYISADAIKLANALAASSGVVIAQFPSGYRPSKLCVAPVLGLNYKLITAYITTGGNLYIYSNTDAITTGVSLYFSATYFI